MANIIQLVEKGVKLFTQTHVDAVEGLDNKLKPIKDAVEFKTAPKKISDFANNAVFKGGNITITRVGNLVQLSGTIKLASVGNWSANLIAKLPKEFWPANNGLPEGVTISNVVFVDGGTNTPGLIIRVTPGGDFNVMRNQLAQTTDIMIHQVWLADPI